MTTLRDFERLEFNTTKICKIIKNQTVCHSARQSRNPPGCCDYAQHDEKNGICSRACQFRRALKPVLPLHLSRPLFNQPSQMFHNIPVFQAVVLFAAQVHHVGVVAAAG